MLQHHSGAGFRDALDIVFENRNKAYGAYQLRRDEDKYLIRALVIGLMIIGAAILISRILSSLELGAPADPEVANISLTTAPKLDEPLPNKAKIEPPKPAGPSAPKNTIKFLPPVLSPEELNKNEPPPGVNIPEDTDKTISRRDENGIPGDDIPDPNDTYGHGIITDNSKHEPDTIVSPMYIQKSPGFPGGDNEMFRYLAENIKYPKLAIENNLEGTVTVSFVVNRDGSITDAVILKDVVGGGCAKEAMRVVQGMPKWIPGEANGHPVRVRFTLPVRFRLSK